MLMKLKEGPRVTHGRAEQGQKLLQPAVQGWFHEAVDLFIYLAYFLLHLKACGILVLNQGSNHTPRVDA